MSKGKFYNKNKNRNKQFSPEESVQSALDAGSKAKKEDLLRPVEDLKLDENLLGYLKAGRINILADLACRDFQQMYKIQNIGRKQCLAIASAMSKFGVKFARDIQQDGNRSQHRDGRDRNHDNQRGSSDKRNHGNVNADEQFSKKNKNNFENAKLNQYLSKLYNGLTMSEILMGKRERPASAKVEREPLTEKSLVKFCRKGKWVYKDWKGNVIVAPQYEEAFGFSEERGCVEMDGKLGYIDRNNNLVIDFKYDCANSFSEGLASVTVGEKSGYIDPDGNQVVDFIYDIATPFSGGKAIVRLDDRWG
ncbi:MAG: WG repeat-containing protein, partial [Clostridia bacterium]|nr:WG repeat-containing protein [Clostridia bacterium]